MLDNQLFFTQDIIIALLNQEMFFLVITAHKYYHLASLSFAPKNKQQRQRFENKDRSTKCRFSAPFPSERVAGVSGNQRTEFK